MKISKKISLITLMVIGGCAIAQEASRLDVLGVKPGMTKEEAEKRLKASFPDLQLESTETYRESPGIPQALATLKFRYNLKSGRSNRVTLHFLPLSGKIYSISRLDFIGDRYSPETWTSFKTLQSAFEEKYGKPTYVGKFGSPPGRYVVFDNNGMPTNKEPCMGSVIGGALLSEQDERCGLELGYRWRQGEDRKFAGFASGLDVGLTDFALMNKELKVINAKAAEFEKLQRQQGSANKAPKL